MSRVLRYVYTGLFTILTPLVILRWIIKGRKQPAYCHNISHRLGLGLPTLQNSVWIHAVSLGESVLVTPIIQRLLKKHPTIPIVVTNTTPTGREWIQKQFKNQVYQLYAPLDLPLIVGCFLKRVQPQLALFVETEMWPNWIFKCHQKRIPQILLNARLAQSSAQKYQKIAPLMRSILPKLNLIAAQFPDDAQNFTNLGAPASQIKVVGNLKYDLAPNLHVETEYYRHSIGNRPVFAAISTHAPEENLILETFQRLSKKHPDLLLILVPRHPDRFDTIRKQCEQANFSVAARSSKHPVTPHTQILLGDSMGEMNLYLSLTSLAFVGGSFAPIGGHNVLEPISWGIPTLTGPNTWHFSRIIHDLQKAQAILVVQDSAELEAQINQLLTSKEECQKTTQQGNNFLKAHHGSLDRQWQLINQMLT